MVRVGQHLTEIKNILFAMHRGKHCKLSSVFLLVRSDIHQPLFSSAVQNASDSTNQKLRSSHLPTQSQTETCHPQQELSLRPKLTPLQTTQQIPTSHTSLRSPTPHTNPPSPTPYHLPTLHTFATQYIGSGREHHRRVRRKSTWEEEAERWERRVQRKASGIKQD